MDRVNNDLKIFFFNQPDRDGHQLGREEGRDDAVSEPISDIGQDDGDHRHKVEAFREGGTQMVVSVQQRVHGHRGEREEDQGARGRKQELPV